MTEFWITNARLILPDRELFGSIKIDSENISEIRPVGEPIHHPRVIDFKGLIVCPGFVDLHVHGGGGADFMDGTVASFQTVCQTHFRHGTTSLLATSTAGRHQTVMKMLTAAREVMNNRIAPETRSIEMPHVGKQANEKKARVAGVHLYGPHFHEPAKGCHPTPDFLDSDRSGELLEFHDIIRAATIAPEHPNAREFAHGCRTRGIRLHMGHSHCTFQQAVEAVSWGVGHVDHLFCAMSDRARLRLSQTWPMRGGLMEATLCLDELTTEVIADGCHLAPELLRLAWKIKGPDRLALVTDSMRALDMPPGEYSFGPEGEGQKVVSNGRVGLMPDGVSLASSVQGMDECVRVMVKATGAPLWEVVRMASLTPARIAGLAQQVGSLEVGKRADLAIFHENLQFFSSFCGPSWGEMISLISEK